MEIRFVIPGRIGGKGRPRISTRGGFVRAFTPAKTVATEALVRQFASEAMNGGLPLSGPVALTMFVVICPPVSWSKKKRASAVYVTGKCDPDNTIKLVADAMNSIVYGDDAQISDVVFRRRYSLTEQERVEITVVSLNESSGGIAPRAEGQLRAAVPLDAAARSASPLFGRTVA